MFEEGNKRVGIIKCSSRGITIEVIRKSVIFYLLANMIFHENLCIFPNMHNARRKRKIWLLLVTNKAISNT